jgi:hypothetical protein
VFFTVTGVIKKRDDSHFNYDVLLSLVTKSETNNTILHTYSTQQWLTYFLVENGVNIKTLEEQMYHKQYDLVTGLLAGRDFDEKVTADSVSNCLINETLAHDIGYDNPVNESFHHENWYITMFRQIAYYL